MHMVSEDLRTGQECPRTRGPGKNSADPWTRGPSRARNRARKIAHELNRYLGRPRTRGPTGHGGGGQGDSTWAPLQLVQVPYSIRCLGN